MAIAAHPGYALFTMGAAVALMSSPGERTERVRGL